MLKNVETFVVTVIIAAVLVSCNDSIVYDEIKVLTVPKLSGQFEDFLTQEGVQYTRLQNEFTVFLPTFQTEDISFLLADFHNEFSRGVSIHLRTDDEAQTAYCCDIDGYRLDFLHLIFGSDFLDELEEDISQTVLSFLWYKFNIIPDGLTFKSNFRSPEHLVIVPSLKLDRKFEESVMHMFLTPGNGEYLGRIPSQSALDGSRTTYLRSKYLSDTFVRRFLHDVEMELKSID